MSMRIAVALAALVFAGVSSGEVVLYEHDDFNGRTFRATNSVSNLDGSGFNDKARSLRIESGYWIVCSDADYQGNCQTYGPGHFATLPSGQNHSISSGRRVSGDYPYRNNPNCGC